MIFSVVKVREFPWDMAIRELLEKDLSKDNVARRIRGHEVTALERYRIEREEWESVAVCLRNHPGAAGTVVHARDVLFVLETPAAVLGRFFPPPPEGDKKPWWKFW